MTIVDIEYPPRGRTSISSRALDRLTSAIGATALGVDARNVHVDIGDDLGQLVVTVSSPIRIVSLDRVSHEPGVIARSGGTVLERVERARQEIRARVRELTGYQVRTVCVQLTSVVIRPEERVR